MTALQFELEMQRLKDTYGAPKYPKERGQAFWERFKSISHNDFKRATIRLIANEIHAPMLGKFEEELSEVLKNLRAEEFQNLAGEGETCFRCRGVGIVSLRKNDGYPGEACYAFKCSCKLGERYANFPSIPTTGFSKP